jgi:hypothetical protein
VNRLEQRVTRLNVVKKANKTPNSFYFGRQTLKNSPVPTSLGLQSLHCSARIQRSASEWLHRMK